jgi:hypothetical protein
MACVMHCAAPFLLCTAAFTLLRAQILSETTWGGFVICCYCLLLRFLMAEQQQLASYNTCTACAYALGAAVIG